MPPVVWKGEHLRYRTYEPIVGICEGTFEYLDRRVGDVKRRLAAPSTMADFSWTPGSSLTPYCDSTLGCS
ncbi:MAG: hypothetical protein AAF721_41860, partial [Myxococcota bacterium]